MNPNWNHLPGALRCSWFLLFVGFVATGVPNIRAQPLNDAARNALVLSEWAPRISDSGNGATFDPDDTAEMQDNFGGAGGGSLWYSWTSPVSGTVRVEREWSIMPQHLFLDRHPFMMMPNDYFSSPAPASFNAVKGATYMFTVITPSVATPGGFGLGFGYSFSFDQPEFVRLVLPKDGTTFLVGQPITIETLVTFQPKEISGVEILIFDGYIEGPWLYLPPLSFKTTTVPTLGGHYQISAAIRLNTGYLIGQTQRLSITVLPANDHFADRALLRGLRTQVGVATRLATRESNEPLLTGAPDARSIWWKWAAPSTGPVTVVVSGFFGAGKLAIYTGESLETLQMVSTETIEIPAEPLVRHQSISFDGHQGIEYSIAYETSDFGFTPEELTLSQTVVIPERLKLGISHIRSSSTLILEAFGPSNAVVSLLGSDDSRTFNPISTQSSGSNGIARFVLKAPLATTSRFFRATASQ